MDLFTTRRALVIAPFAAATSRLAAAPACPAARPRPFGDMVGLGVKFSQGQPEREIHRSTPCQPKIP